MEAILGEVQLIASQTPLHVNEIKQLQFNLNRISESVKNNKLQVKLFCIKLFQYEKNTILDFNIHDVKSISTNIYDPYNIYDFTGK